MVKRVIALFPDGDLAGVEDFRSRWDPLADAVPAHVTLAYPYDDDRSVEELVQELAAAARGFSPFGWRASALSIEDGEYLFLLPDATGRELVQRLHEAVYAGPLRRVTRPQSFLPHMTVGRTRDPAQLAAATSAARDAALTASAEITMLSAYRIEGGKRIRDIDCPLGK